MIGCDKILSGLEMDYVIKRAISRKSPYKLIKSEVRPATEGLAGFLGEHLKILLHVQVEEEDHKIFLFVKKVPTENEVKAAFINENNFFTKEAFVLKILEEITTPDTNPWCPTTYIKNEKVIVMPDLATDGYTTRPVDKPFDISHVSLTSIAIARFHAAFTNYESKRTFESESDNLSNQYGILTESTFLDTPWTRTGAKLHEHFLNEFSKKFRDSKIDLFQLYQKAFNSLHHYDDTLNVLVHKDLWANNIMFKYDNGVPTNALLIDFQLVRYAPPAFDIMIMLYMTTTKEFRAQNEEDMLRKYFNTFINNIDKCSEKKLKDLNYNWNTFREWCDKARTMAMVVAVLICPFALINATYAKNIFYNTFARKGSLIAPISIS